VLEIITGGRADEVVLGGGLHVVLARATCLQKSL
jgi:hypothetical protein